MIYQGQQKRMRNILHFLPLITTAISTPFTFILYRHWNGKRASYLLWWTVGVFFYGIGTLTESLTTLFGWNAIFFKAWYITGALLGGAPLAQGSVYLLFRNERLARRLAVMLVAIILCVSMLVLFSPLRTEHAETYRLSGSVLEWQWIRLFTPVINLYAFIFLVGGAFYSAYKYLKRGKQFHDRFLGNIFIAVGALLPGVGGASAKAGYVEVLYVTELIGIILIWIGYHAVAHSESVSIHEKQRLSLQNR